MPETNPTAGPLNPEGPHKQETSPKQVFEAFQKGLSFYKRSMLNLKGKAEESLASLSQKEKRQLSDFEVCEQGSQKVGEDGKLISIETSAGTSHEGIPVEGMIEALNEQIEENSRQIGSLKDEQEKDELVRETIEIQQTLKTIVDNSIPFRDARIDEGLDESAFFEERTKAEAEFISQDPLRKSENETEKQEGENWFNAQEALKRRRELILPKEAEKAEEVKVEVGKAANMEDVLNHLSSAVDRDGQGIIGSAPTPEAATSAPEPIRVTPPKEVAVESGHGYPFIEDSPDNISARVTFDEVKKASGEADPSDTDRVKQLRGRMGKINGFLSDPEVVTALETALPKRPGESTGDYRARTLELLVNDQNGRLVFLGDNEKKNDPISTLLINKGFRSEVETPRLLQAAEGLYYMELDAQNKAKQELYRQAILEGKFDMATYIEEARGVVDIGGSSSIYEQTPEGKVRKEMATRDNQAAALLTNGLASLTYEVTFDPSTGEKRSLTFNQKMESLLERRRKTDIPEEKALIHRQINGEYKKYYNRVLEVMAKREKAINPFSSTDPSEVFEAQAYSLFQELKNSPQQAVETLISRYQENPSFKRLPDAVRANTLSKIRATFEKPEAKADFLGYAHKGVDYLERRMELYRIPKPELSEIPSELYAKKWKQDGEYHRFKKIGKPVEEVASTVTPPERKGEGETGKTPEAAPAGEGEGKGEKEPKGKGENPEGAPAAGEEKLEELASNLDAGAGFIDKERKAQNMLQVADHLFADDLRTETKSLWYRARDKALGWSYRIPLLGGVIRGITHPVQMIWQQGLARSVFEQQHIRFAADLNATLQTTGGKGIPVEMTIEMAQKAIDEGIALKKQEKSVLKKFGWMVTDTLKGFTGISQTSEQQLAKKWLGDELAKPEDQRVAELRMTGSQTISEQTDLGERYAQWNKTLTFEQSNKVKISSEAGETRHQLPEQMRKPVSDRLKGFIADFAEGKLTEKQLIEKVNEYLMGEVRADLIKTDPNLAKELDTQEVGSNILNLARYVTGRDNQGNTVEENRWQRYQTEKGKEKSKWEELEVSLLVGKAEFGRVRGHKEMGFLADNLARRLSERGGVSEKLQAGATAYAKDIVTNVASYAAGYWGAALGMSILNIPKNTALKVLGGFAGIAGGAALKETGFAIMPLAKKLEFTKWGHKFTPFMIKGRYLKEVEQLSREAAKGRLTPERARIRKEMGTLLVPRLKVQELLEGVGTNAGLESLVYKKDDLSPVEAKRLFSQLVDIRARMRMTDKSQTGAMDYKTQNYFEFIEGHENQQNERLTRALEQGLAKLIKSGQEDLLGPNKSFDRYDNLTAVAEAQLRYSTADKKAMGKWLQKEKGLTKQEADNWVSNMLPDIDLQIQKTDSIRSKNRRLTLLTLERGASTFFKAAITGMATEGIRDFTQDVQHGGFHEAFGELKQIYIEGKPPLELNDQGQLVADLTAGQKFYLGARYWIEPPFPSTGHFTQIDNVNLNLPGSLSYQEQVINGHTYQALVDIRTGDVKMDLTGFKLDYRDVNGDSHLELVAIDDTSGQVITGGLLNGEAYVTDLFHRAGIDLKPDGVRGSIDQPVEAFNPAAMVSKGADINGDGKVDVTTKIPDNTSWQYDPASGKMDLHGTNIDGTDRVLIQDATIGPDGQITGGVYDHNLINIKNTPGGTGPEINVEPVSGSEIWGAAAHYRVVHAHAESTEAIRNQTFSTGDTTGEHPIGVRYTFPGHTIINPDTGATESLAEAAVDNRVGLLLQIPSFGPLGEDVGIFVPAHFDVSLNKFVVDFNPTDTTTMIKLPDGSEISMADFSRNFLNEAKLAEYVKQNGGPGLLDSETWYEGREFFNLANPDGNIMHQGRILGGYFDTDSKATEYGFTPAPGQTSQGAFIAIHADHASGLVNRTIPEGPPQPSPSIPEINVGSISDTNTIDQLGYRVESPPFAYKYEPNPMIPMRENIEKGESGKAQPTTQSPSTATPPATVKTTPIPAVVTEEPASAENTVTEKKEPTAEEKQRLEKMTEQAKKVLSTESKSGKKYSEEVYEQLLAELKLDPEQIRQYFDQSLESSLVDDEDAITHVSEKEAVGYDDNLDKALLYLKGVCEKLGIKNAEQLKGIYFVRLRGKFEEQLAEKDSAKRNPALHRMASLAAVMDLADRGELNMLFENNDKEQIPDTQPSATQPDKKPADDEEEKNNN